MAWTTKSSRPQSFFRRVEQRDRGSPRSRRRPPATIFEPSFSTIGSTRLPNAAALVGEGHLGARGMQRLGDAPGDRAVVGHAHDQAALAGHQLGDVGQVDGLGRRVGSGRAVPPPEASGAAARGGRQASFPSSGRSARTAGRRWCRRSRSCSTSRSAGRHCRCAGGRSDSRSAPGSRFSMLAEAATKSSFSISRRVDRLVRAGRALAVAGQRLGRADGRQLVVAEDARGWRRAR